MPLHLDNQSYEGWESPAQGLAHSRAQEKLSPFAVGPALPKYRSSYTCFPCYNDDDDGDDDGYYLCCVHNVLGTIPGWAIEYCT